MGSALATVLLVAASVPAGGLLIDPAASSVHYHLDHPMHHIDGESRQLEGKAVVKDDGTVLAMVRLPITSLRSGDANRDAHMLEVLEIGKFPFVVFKGVARLGPGGALPGGPLAMQGEVEIHGVRRPVAVPLTVELEAGGAMRVRGGFQVSLEGHGIERPSLLFAKVDDACRVDLDLQLRREKP